MSDNEWEKRYQDHINSGKRKGRRGLTLRDLFLVKQSSARGQDVTKPESPEFEEELAEWCEKVDDLSMLLWMALTMEGEGQSHL